MLTVREQPRKVGGVGTLRYPLLSDITKSISQNYSVACRLPHVALPRVACVVAHEYVAALLNLQAD